MASTLLRRAKALLSSVSDDYFDDPDVVDLLNDAKTTIVSNAIKLEMDQPKRFGRSIRALNNLRVEQSYNSLSFSAYRDFYSVDLDVSGITPENLLFIGGYNTDIPITFSELLQNRRYELDAGLVQPSARQAYWYYVLNETPDPDQATIRIYFSTNDNAITVSVNYIKQHQLLTDTSEDLIDLPDRLIKAVILRAAIDGANMEVRENTDNYLKLYSNELESHLW